jgi:hypothetical protein
MEPIEKIKMQVDIWKKVIDVQQHFNEIEMRIRNYAITVLLAVLSASGLSLKEKIWIDFFGQHPLAFWLLIFGCLAWISFYMMDRCWYHRLLYGSVKHAMAIEDKLKEILPEITLSNRIKEESPIQIKCISRDLI